MSEEKGLRDQVLSGSVQENGIPGELFCTLLPKNAQNAFPREDMNDKTAPEAPLFAHCSSVQHWANQKPELW